VRVAAARTAPSGAGVEAQATAGAQAAPQPVAVGGSTHWASDRYPTVAPSWRGSVECRGSARRRARRAGVQMTGRHRRPDREIRDPLALARASGEVDGDGDRAKAQREDRVQRARRRPRAPARCRRGSPRRDAAGLGQRAPARRLAEQLGVGQRVTAGRSGWCRRRGRQASRSHGWTVAGSRGATIAEIQAHEMI